MVGRRCCGVVVAVLVLCFVSVQGAEKAEEEVGHEARCGKTVRVWSAEQLRLMASSAKSEIDHLKVHDFLFFLHIPRTGGRTFHQCFLKHLFPSEDRCPRSYDKLRFDRSRPGCRLLSTHDDYSILNRLPNEATSVVTTVRDPLDRVLSAYEFAIEVAARYLKTIPKKSGDSLSTNSKPIVSGMSTLNIWPWKYLVPAMREDLFSRRVTRLASESVDAGNGSTNVTLDSQLVAGDPYDTAAMVMPLREFISHPLAHDLVHNGATLQIAGLTNISFSETAREIRNCISKFPHLGKEHVLKVAKDRLDNMLHVGLTENQRASAEFFATVVARQISVEQLFRDISRSDQRGRGSSSPIQATKTSQVLDNETSFHELKWDEILQQVMTSYDGCVDNLRTVQSSRRRASLKLVAPVIFSRETRMLIPPDLIEDLLKLNSLDVELFEHAQSLFERQKTILDAEYLKLGISTEGAGNSTLTTISTGIFSTIQYEDTSLLESVFGLLHTAVATLTMAFVALGAVIFLVTKRRASRVKET